MFNFKAEPLGTWEVEKVLILDGDKEIGFFLLMPHSSELYEIHTNLNIEAYGSGSAIGKEGLVWLFNNYPSIVSVISKIPTFNKAARKMAINNGFTPCGIISKSYKMPDNSYVDQEIMVLSRGDI